MNKMVIIIIAVVLLLVIVGAVVFLVVLPGNSEPAPLEYKLHKLPEAYANIATDGKILKYEMTIEYSGVDLGTAFEADQQKIKDAVNNIFLSKEYDIVNSVNGKRKIGIEIQEYLLETYETTEEFIPKIYFPVFLVQ